MGRTVKTLLAKQIRRKPDVPWPKLLPDLFAKWNESHRLRGTKGEHTPLSFYDNYEDNLNDVWRHKLPQVVF